MAEGEGIQVTFLDQTGAKSVKAKISPTVEVKKIIPNIITKMQLPVTAPEAALGTSIEVPTLRGKVSMKIPPATSSGRTFRLPGYGMPRLKGGGAGDQLVAVRIVIPSDVTPAERELYEKLKALRADNPRAYLG